MDACGALGGGEQGRAEAGQDGVGRKFIAEGTGDLNLAGRPASRTTARASGTPLRGLRGSNMASRAPGRNFISLASD